MSNFIYVFTEEDRDALLSQGYCLLKADNNNNNLFIFKNNDTIKFSLSEDKVVFSDTLTF